MVGRVLRRCITSQVECSVSSSKSPQFVYGLKSQLSLTLTPSDFGLVYVVLLANIS